jgi:hypothetical protein
MSIKHLCHINYKFSDNTIISALNKIYVSNSRYNASPEYNLNALEYLAKNFYMNDNMMTYFINKNMYILIIAMIAQRETINCSTSAKISDELFKKINETDTTYLHHDIKIYKNELLNVLKYKYNLTSMTFYCACVGCHLETIAHFLDNKFMPKIEHFKASLMRGDIDNRTKIINLFIEYGYNLTYECLLLTIKSRVIINSIDNYNFNYDDDKFIFACIYANFHPYIDKIKNKSKLLLYSCALKNNAKNVKYLIDLHVKPNIDCLVEACKINDKAIVKLILGEGMIPNLQCLQICEANGNKIIRKMILEQYIDTHDESIHNTITSHTLFGNVINCNDNKKHNLLPAMVAFYKNNFPDELEEKKQFNKIKKNINSYIKNKNLLKSHKLSFKIDKELSQFGLNEGAVIQIHDMITFISYIIMYKYEPVVVKVNN